MRFVAIAICLLCGVVRSPAARGDPDETDIINEPDSRPLLFTTLGGGMIALEQTTGRVLWTLKDEPVVKAPNDNSNADPQFLPDPRHGSLYLFGTHAGHRHILKKLPFTIPQLVANAPCRSSDGILYTGKKIDTWFMIDPKTGIRRQVVGHDKVNPFEDAAENTCPLDTKNAVYVARTEYNVLMYDSKNKNNKWNVTFYDYSAHNMGNDMLNNYGIVHFTSTANGRITSFDRKNGQMLWSLTMESPIVAAYLLDRDGLLTVPFNTVGDDTMDHIMEDISTLQEGKGLLNSNMELFPSLYIGEHNDGLYALSSLVDKTTITIDADGPLPLLLEGPEGVNANSDDQGSSPSRRPSLKHNLNVHYNLKKVGNEEIPSAVLLLGHYTEPEYLNMNFKGSSKSTSMLPINYVNAVDQTQLQLIMGPKEKNKDWFEIENASKSDTLSQDDTSPIVLNPNRTDENVDRMTENVVRNINFKFIVEFISSKMYELMFSIGMIVSGGVTVVFLIRIKTQYFGSGSSRSSSQRTSSTHSNSGRPLSVAEDLEDGSVRIGKITFQPTQVLGKGCDGTLVYRGNFEKRSVAVKRMISDYFSLADREVALLTESDAHANVIRYYCTEQDKLFRYIALELCSATLQDYVQDGLGDRFGISNLDVLRQATAGLAHLHSIDIVHRDIKPQNVLLSVPNAKNSVKVLISDFGLCKKLNKGHNSFSRGSGITGTDGWIAPEILKGERTTTSVDIFSLGCVFYYVLSKGKHPFGANLERQANILKGEKRFDHLKSTMSEEELDLSLCLIERMVSGDPEARPSANVINMHPLFWTKQKVLTFFQDVSDRVERDPPGGPLEYGGMAVVRGDWRGRVCSSVASDLRKYRSYNGDSVRDLLRALRNKKHHYRELTPDAQTSLGSIPDDFTSYWLKRFPKLLLHTWLQMQFYKSDVPLNSYYDERYEFDRGYIMGRIDDDDLMKYNTETLTQNQLFVKSRNFYDHEKGKRIKFRDGFDKRARELPDGEEGDSVRSHVGNTEPSLPAETDAPAIQGVDVKNSPGRPPTTGYYNKKKRRQLRENSNSVYNYGD